MLQLSLFPSAVDLAKVDDDRNMRRFYRLSIVGDLFGGPILYREWGRIGSPGRLAATLYDSEGEAVTVLGLTALSKRRRGYTTREER